MKSMHLPDASKQAALIDIDVPQPEPREQEVLVRVYAAGITPTELAWYPTSHTKSGEKRTGAVQQQQEIIEYFQPHQASLIKRVFFRFGGPDRRAANQR